MCVCVQLARLIFLMSVACVSPHAGASPLTASSDFHGQLDNGNPQEQHETKNPSSSANLSTVSAQPHNQGPSITTTQPLGRTKTIALESSEWDISAKWEDLRSRMRIEEQVIESCRTDLSYCPETARLFLEIVALGRQSEGRARLGVINRAVNLRIKPASDWVQYRVDDFWSAPLATLRAGAGDCEDYAILKYAALRELGIAPDDLRLMIVHDIRHSSNHAILAVRNEKQWLILDNRTFVLVKAEDARHYLSLVVLDHRGARKFEAVAFH